MDLTEPSSFHAQTRLDTLGQACITTGGQKLGCFSCRRRGNHDRCRQQFRHKRKLRRACRLNTKSTFSTGPERMDSACMYLHIAPVKAKKQMWKCTQRSVQVKLCEFSGNTCIQGYDRGKKSVHYICMRTNINSETEIHIYILWGTILWHCHLMLFIPLLHNTSEENPVLFTHNTDSCR